MKVVTTIVITEEVQPGFEDQVKRNFERVPVCGVTCSGIKKHLQNLIPALTDEKIQIDFRLEEPNLPIHQLVGENDEVLMSWLIDGNDNQKK